MIAMCCPLFTEKLILENNTLDPTDLVRFSTSKYGVTAATI
jgi:hypothetical protein